MKLKLFYFGILSFLGVSGTAMYQIINPTPAFISEPVKVQEQAQQVEAVQTEQPVLPEKITPKPIPKVQPKPVVKDNSAKIAADQAKVDKEFADIMKDINEPAKPYVPASVPKPAPIDNSAAIAAAAQKKYEQCRKDLQSCMNNIGSQIMNLSGSAYSSAARSLGDSCNRKYSC